MQYQSRLITWFITIFIASLLPLSIYGWCQYGKYSVIDITKNARRIDAKDIGAYADGDHNVRLELFTDKKPLYHLHQGDFAYLTYLDVDSVSKGATNKQETGRDKRFPNDDFNLYDAQGNLVIEDAYPMINFIPVISQGEAGDRERADIPANWKKYWPQHAFQVRGIKSGASVRVIGTIHANKPKPGQPPTYRLGIRKVPYGFGDHGIITPMDDEQIAQAIPESVAGCDYIATIMCFPFIILPVFALIRFPWPGSQPPPARPSVSESATFETSTRKKKQRKHQ